ncbi:MAG TPA: hypothetical protein PLJ00_15005 [Chitinophagales bacterium]|nr:hypothetical protein [Chitinophagales bacterium]
MPRINIFSKKKDGTTFIQDLGTISKKTQLFFDALPGRLKKWLYEATVLIDVMQKLDDKLEEGAPLGEAIEHVLETTRPTIDDKLFQIVREMLSRVDEFRDGINQVLSGEEKAKAVVNQLLISTDLSNLEADTLNQVAVYTYKNQ